MYNVVTYCYFHIFLCIFILFIIYRWLSLKLKQLKSQGLEINALKCFEQTWFQKVHRIYHSEIYFTLMLKELRSVAVLSYEDGITGCRYQENWKALIFELFQFWTDIMNYCGYCNYWDLSLTLTMILDKVTRGRQFSLICTIEKYVTNWI